jgi:hypothetical protein
MDSLNICQINWLNKLWVLSCSHPLVLPVAPESRNPDFHTETMNNNNNSAGRGRGQKRKREPSAAAERKALKNEILNEIRIATGNPAQGKGRGKRNRAAKRGAGPSTPAAAAFATGQHSQPPSIERTGSGSCRIRHRELLASVTGSSAFVAALSFSLNPGLVASFPWLSIEAQGWEMYHFNSLKFEYYTRTGTSTPGSVIMAPDYDAADVPPANEQVASSYEDTEEDAPWKDICCVLREKSLAGGVTKKFVRTAVLPVNQDIKTYDSGTFYLATTDGTAVPWGKLWVEYDVTFYTPQLPPLGPVFFAGGAVTSGGTITPSTPLGTAPQQAVNSSGFFALGNNMIQFIATGQYLVVYQVTGTGVAATEVFTGNAGTVITQLTSIDVNTAATILEQGLQITVNVPNSTVTLNVTATTVTNTFVAVAIAPPGSL